MGGLEQERARFFGELRLHFLESPGGHGAPLRARRTLEEHHEVDRLLDARARGEQPVVGEQDRLRLAEGGGNDSSLVVGDRNARPLGEVCRAVQHRGVHVDRAKWLAGRGERRSMRRMGVHDRVHVGPSAIDPEVETNPGVRPPALERAQIFVHEHHAFGGRLVEAVAELERPPRAWLVAARGDLSGKTRLVSFGREDATTSGKRFRHWQFRCSEVGLHLPADTLQKIRFVPLVHRPRQV